MMFKRLNILFIIGFAISLLLVCVQSFFHWLPEPEMTGFTVGAKKPVLSWGGWINGDFQKACDAWFNEHIGFRSLWVKTENQLNFSFFRQISAKTNSPGTRIILGKNNYLYEKWYVDSYVSSGLASTYGPSQLAIKMAALQDALRKRGIGFVVVISPSKAEIYSKDLPERYHRIEKRVLYQLPTNYEETINTFRKYDINVVDGHDIFKNKIDEGCHLFQRGGTHWNYIGAFAVLKEIILNLDDQIRNIISVPSIKSIDMKLSKGRDCDLADLSNLWTESKILDLAPYPEFDVNKKDDDRKCNLLIVGTSFSFSLIELLQKNDIFKRLDFLYWSKRHMSWPDGGDYPFKPESEDWHQLLLGKDAVILEMNEALLPYVGWSFFDEALQRLG